MREDPRSVEIIKPILRGRDIKRYQVNWKDRCWLIATLPTLRLNIDGYPAIKRYLLSFGEERLEQTGRTLQDGTKSRKKTNHAWYELQDTCAYYEEFAKDKIVWGNIAYSNSFALLDKTTYLNAPGNILTSDNVNLKYLLGCLNSRVFNYEFKQTGIFLGHAFEWKKQYVEQVRIPAITPLNKSLARKIEAFVDEILAINQNAICLESPVTQSKARECEKQIDRLVYQLYNLTDEEIALVERTNQLKREF